MKKFFQFIILLLAIYGAYCFYDNHLRTFVGVEEKTEETVTASENTKKAEKTKSSKRKSKSSSSKQDQHQTEQVETKDTKLQDSPQKNSNSDEFEEEVEEAEFIPKTR